MKLDTSLGDVLPALDPDELQQLRKNAGMTPLALELQDEDPLDN